ncbi:MAG: MerR family DNA-binding transcriptional regulator [Burkholderiaceae bacterium]|nr:MerR family DNA-binding transcriptional regulator [Burkholderiaceae bacterium]
MRVTESARAAGVSPDTVRYYARLGLIKAERRTDSGYRQFSARMVARVRFIRSAVGLGFKLGDVAELLGMSEQGRLPCPRARAILADRLHEKQDQVAHQMALFRRMKQALKAWETMPDGVPEGHHVCGLIESQPHPGGTAREAGGPRHRLSK